MDKINKYQTIVILIAVIVGLVIGQSSLISGHLGILYYSAIDGHAFRFISDH